MCACRNIQDEGGERPVTSATAIIAFFLSLLFFVRFLPVIGALLGIAAVAVALKVKVNRASRILAAMAILIGGVYAAWMIPVLQRCRASAHSVLVRNNLMQIGLAFLVYESRAGAMPPTLQAAVDAGCAERMEIFEHPRIDRSGFDPGAVDATGGFYYFPLKIASNELAPRHAAFAPIACEKRIWHPRGLVYVLYADGHAWVCEPEKLQADIEKNGALYAVPPRLPTAAAD